VKWPRAFGSPRATDSLRLPHRGVTGMPSAVGLVIRLDGLRKQRNLTEYTGDLVPESAVAECLAQACSLYATTVDWLKVNKKELL